jgi:hypothetical protein
LKKVIDFINMDEQDDKDDTIYIYYRKSGLFAGHSIGIFLDSNGTIFDAGLIG